MRSAVLLMVMLPLLALPSIADAQQVDFTVDSRYARGFPISPRMSLAPQVLRDEAEAHKPKGAGEGATLLGVSAYRESMSGRSTLGLGFLDELDSGEGATPFDQFERGRLGKRERRGFVTYVRRFGTECKKLIC